MRNTVKVGLFFCMLFLLTAKVQAVSAESKLQTETKGQFGYLITKEEAPTPTKQKTAEKPEKKIVKPAAPAPVTYTVAAGDSLVTIASTHQSQWERLFYKNTQIEDPNVINVGDVITIPAADEQLTERPLPTASENTSTVIVSTTIHAEPQPRASSAGNTYTPGYCTWYAKNRRPDLPNRLGNASAWVANAAAQGFATGTTPQAGAIGQQGNHVVYVESVNGDGTVTISEMNYHGLFVISSRTVSANSFVYIY